MSCEGGNTEPDKENVHALIKAMIEDEFDDAEERMQAAIFMGSLTFIAMRSEPHIVIPMVVGFLRMTLELTACERCKDIIRANLKEVN